MNFTYYNEHDDTDHSRPFKLNYNDIQNITFTCDCRDIKKSEWLNLLENLKNNGSYSLSFDVYNGNVSISTRDGKFCLSVGNYGGHNLGDLSIKDDNHKIIDAITKLISVSYTD
uniref:Uncharacterized protein n=1 Tax=viral metagenome TaxID=1070528 RepID=A0A6C0LR64_9ZZZZ